LCFTTWYVALDGRLMSVAIQLGSDTVDAATPVPLFEAHLAARSGHCGRQYMMSADGKRFLIDAVISAEVTTRRSPWC
jgi:hypothetical protein